MGPIYSHNPDIQELFSGAARLSQDILAPECPSSGQTTIIRENHYYHDSGWGWPWWSGPRVTHVHHHYGDGSCSSTSSSGGRKKKEDDGKALVLLAGIVFAGVAAAATYFVGQGITEQNREKDRLEQLESLKGRVKYAGNSNRQQYVIDRITDLQERILQRRYSNAATSCGATMTILGTSVLGLAGCVLAAPALAVAGGVGLAAGTGVKLYQWGASTEKLDKDDAREIQSRLREWNQVN